MHHELADIPGLTSVERSLLANNVGAAIDASRHLGAHSEHIASVARVAFVDSMGHSLWIAAGLAAGAAVIALTQLPRQSAHGTDTRTPVPARHHHHAAAHHVASSPGAAS
jgi:hypothetical protein